MKKPLLMSLAVAALLSGNANAATMYDRFQTMEDEMKQLQNEIADLKAEKASASVAEDDDEESDDGAVATAYDEDEDDDADSEDGDDEDDDEDDDDDMSFEEETEESLEYFDKTLSTINRNTAGNHLKFGVDLRTAVDNIQYKMAGKNAQGEDTAGNDALLTNRLWIKMNWAATDTLSFTGQLAYNKAYGARSGWGNNYAGMETFDWIASENPYDDVVRVRAAYFFYHDTEFFGLDMPWTFSVGRRPSTNGHLINLRDDDPASSPMGHAINVEFDGLSAKFTLMESIGMYVKFCAGRGGTNAAPKFFAVDPINSGAIAAAGTPYATNSNDIPDIDLGGLIFVPYNDGQYALNTQFYYANNLIDANIDNTKNPAAPSIVGMQAVGGLYSATANLIINGIGNEWSDFLDDTTLFFSGAMSVTNPDKTGNNDVNGNPVGMLGSLNPETGYSYWAGLQTPTFSENGHFGLEYNHGTKYWRSITYGEDTLAGSKIAARGDAYEAYWTEPIVDDILSIQLRATYIDYAYTGSNGFFGDATGTPIKISDIQEAAAAGNAQAIGIASQTVDTAQDIRFYIRYRY